jgi:hypothetical protein
MFSFESLHARQFIHATGSLTSFSSLGCLSIDLTPLTDFLFPLWVFLFG